MISPTNYQLTDDAGFDIADQVLHDIVYRAAIFGRVSPRVPVTTAILQIDEAGAIPQKARELIASAYPNLFLSAPEVVGHQTKESQH